MNQPNSLYRARNAANTPSSMTTISSIHRRPGPHWDGSMKKCHVSHSQSGMRIKRAQNIVLKNHTCSDSVSLRFLLKSAKPSTIRPIAKSATHKAMNILILYVDLPGVEPGCFLRVYTQCTMIDGSPSAVLLGALRPLHQIVFPISRFPLHLGYLGCRAPSELILAHPQVRQVLPTFQRTQHPLRCHLFWCALRFCTNPSLCIPLGQKVDTISSPCVVTVYLP